MTRDLTPEEARAIAALQRLAKHWPKSLTLLSMDGALCVADTAAWSAANTPGVMGHERHGQCVLADDFNGIPNDGGGW